jgi:hypothetical protein
VVEDAATSAATVAGGGAGWLRMNENASAPRAMATATMITNRFGSGLFASRASQGIRS